MESNKKVKVCDERGSEIPLDKQVELMAYLQQALKFFEEDSERKTKEDSKRKNKKNLSIQFDILKHMLLFRSMIDTISSKRSCIAHMITIMSATGSFADIIDSVKTLDKSRKKLNEYKEKREMMRAILIKIVTCMKEIHTGTFNIL